MNPNSVARYATGGNLTVQGNISVDGGGGAGGGQNQFGQGQANGYSPMGSRGQNQGMPLGRPGYPGGQGMTQAQQFAAMDASNATYSAPGGPGGLQNSGSLLNSGMQQQTANFSSPFGRPLQQPQAQPGYPGGQEGSGQPTGAPSLYPSDSRSGRPLSPFQQQNMDWLNAQAQAQADDMHLFKGGGAVHDLHPVAQAVKSQGRGPDSMLVHMAPREVQGLQALAMAHGGSLTINPETGLPEAGFLSNLLPALIGAGITAFTGIPAWQVGLGVGGFEAIRSGDLGKGISAGLGAYGGAELGSALMGGGTGALSSAAGAEVGAGASYATAGEAVAADQAASQAVAQKLANASPWESLKAGAGGLGAGSGRDAFMNSIGGAKGLGIAGAAAASPFMQGETVTQAPTTPKTPVEVAQLYYNSRATTPEERAAMGRSGEQQYFTGPGYELMDTKTYLAAAGGMTPSEMRPANITPEQFRNMYFGGVDTATKAPKGKSSFNDGGIPWGLNRGEQLTPEQYAERYLSGSGNGNSNSPPDPFVRDPGVMQQYFTQAPPVVEDVVEGEEDGTPLLPIIPVATGDSSDPSAPADPNGFTGYGYGVNVENGVATASSLPSLPGLLGLVSKGLNSIADENTAVAQQAIADNFGYNDDTDQNSPLGLGAQLGLDDAGMTASGATGTGAGDASDAGVSGANAEASHGEDGNDSGPGGDGGDAGGTSDAGDGGGEAQGGLIGLAKGGGLASGSFVIPADVLSAAGNGSTKAGLAAINTQLMGRKAGGATLINGKGDGLSDSIPTHIDGRKPARVADGEAYIDPRTVTRLGGGDAKKGAAKLYSMMDKIRKQAHGKKTQQRPVNMARALA